MVTYVADTLTHCDSSSIREHVKKTAAFYDAEPVRSTWASRQYRRILAHYYSLLIPPDASVLEVGCASGELLALLPNRNVAGIDISGRQLERARERVPHGRFFWRRARNFASANASTTSSSRT